MYPSDNTGSKPNPDAKTVTIDMMVWNEILNPYCYWKNVKSPFALQRPTLNDLLGDNLQQVADESKDAMQKNTSSQAVKKSTTKPPPYKVFSKGVTEKNRLDNPQAIKESQSDAKPDTNYYIQPKRKN